MKATCLNITRDRNGNKTVSFKSCTGKRGFSIQTSGNTPGLNRLPTGETIAAHSRVELWKEFLEYVRDFGTARQKSFFELTDI